MATRLPTASVNAACDAIVDRVDGGSGAGTIEIRTGSQPASANDAATGTLLVTITCADPAFGAAAAGVATLDCDPVLEANAVADGTAGWGRLKDSTGATVMDGSVTATGGGGQITLATTAITTGVAVQLTSGTFTVPAS
jgi:hypothetical protein